MTETWYKKYKISDCMNDKNYDVSKLVIERELVVVALFSGMIFLSIYLQGRFICTADVGVCMVHVVMCIL